MIAQVYESLAIGACIYDTAVVAFRMERFETILLNPDTILVFD